MQAALTTLAAIRSKGAKIAVLGDMFELGTHSVREHRRLGRAAAAAALDGLYLLGAHAHQVRRAALAGGMRAEQVVVGKDHGDLASRLRDRVTRGDWLLFKGSRGMQMEKVLHMLKGGRA
jgi:UDP-N-acetylmuramoyl-tripeptide--D-alanyl-D-alanine ligase